jgi:cyclic beta-1,2-glucan synthetase
MADLVILNEESSSYEQPLKERLESLIQARAMFTAVDQPGGVFLLNIDQMPTQDLTLFLSAAHVSLIAARGPLSQQLAAHSETPEAPLRIRTRTIAEEPSAPLAFMELPYFNSLGGFTPEGHEYVIYLGPGTHAPAPWINVMSNPSFGALVSESGSGFSWYGNSQRNRLTDWSNDPVLDPPSEAIYIRDEETGAFWTPTARPIRETSAYRARHGAGYSVFEHNSHAIEQTLTVFVPMDEAGGAPVKLQQLRLRNDSGRRRRLSITYYLGWTLGESREASQLHTVTEWEEESGALLATNGYHPDYPDRVAFAAMSPVAESFSGDRTEFLGRLGNLRYPAAMQHAGLSGRTGAGLDPCAALQTRVVLNPGEELQLTCMLGQASSLKQAQQLVHKYRESLAVEAALDQTRSWWDRLLGAIQVKTPEPSADLLLNRWLLYQSLSCRIWGRSAFYQSSGAFGFRDQLQDVLALLTAAPELAREHILLAARHQFGEGDVQHWWHPPADAGTRTRVSDDLLWLPHAVAQYVRVTGDAGILQERIPFLRAPLLEDDQHELFLEPAVGPEQASLFEHCRRSVERGLTAGPHGLPLIGTGDWNDAMNRVGVEGKGESVWLAWFLVEVLSGMAELAGRMGETELMREYRARGSELAARVERQAWDGEWYLRATFDDGSPIGSAASQEAKIDSLPQSWAWLSGAGDPERARMAIESAWKYLVLEDQKLVLLLKPPFDKAEPSPGYIQGYPPGVRENGGQYTHAALWLAMAFARSGDGDRAVRLLRMLNPIEHARNAEEVWRYGVEPYAVASDVYRLPGREGQGGWTWYTGSAAWMYRAWIEEVLGVKVLGDRLMIDPVIPSSWDRFSLRLRHGQAVYEIEVENPDGLAQGVRMVELDGRELAERAVPLESELVKHRVRVLMGSVDRTEKGDPAGPAESPPLEG